MATSRRCWKQAVSQSGPTILNSEGVEGFVSSSLGSMTWSPSRMPRAPREARPVTTWVTWSSCLSRSWMREGALYGQSEGDRCVVCDGSF